MRIDLHTHSSVSDGTDSPAELVANAAAAGLDVVALTDHDTFDGLDEAVGFPSNRVSLVVLIGGLIGAAAGFSMQAIAMAYRYPFMDAE